MMNDTELWLPSPAGPAPGLCNYQAEAAFGLLPGSRLAVGASLRFSALTRGSSQPTAVAAQARVHEVFVSLLQRGFAGKLSALFPLPVCVCFGRLGTSFSSALIALILSPLLLLISCPWRYRTEHMLSLGETSSGCVRSFNGGG